jgi:hypothetical protein
MKIEIDLNDILRDEFGSEENLAESIRRQIIERFYGDFRKRLFERMDAEVSLIMTQQINAVMTEKMPELIDDIMNVAYTPVSTYGQRGAATTFRDEIIKSIAANMKYEPRNYSSEENAFTKAVKSIVEKQTEAIKAEIIKQVDPKFKEDAIKFAVKTLSERLGLEKPK